MPWNQAGHDADPESSPLSERQQDTDPEIPPAQRRKAFRVDMRMPAYIVSPFELYCEVQDISVLGVRFDREFPCTPGIVVDIVIEVPNFGASLELEKIELDATVVRTAEGMTAVEFGKRDSPGLRRVQKLVQDQQRMLLVARHYANERKLRDR